MRAIKKTDTSIVEGQWLYYNFIRPHMALDGKTPAETARLDMELGQKKWQVLIEKSAKAQRELVTRKKHQHVQFLSLDPAFFRSLSFLLLQKAWVH